MEATNDNITKTDMMSDNGGTVSPASFSVLYYKRTNKVHKSRGITTVDGILTVESSGVVTLRMENSDDDQSDNEDENDEEEEETKGKKKWKRKKKTSQKSSIVWSGINKTISKGVFGENSAGLNVDDVVILPQVECQIVSILASQNIKSPPIAPKQAVLSKPTLTKKQPLVSRGLQPSKVKTVARRFPVGGARKANLVSSVNTWQARRIPPRQPTQRTALSSDKENQSKATTPPLVARKPTSNSLLQKSSAKKRKLVTAPLSTKSSVQQQQHSNDDFEGAIGNVVVPASVKAVLRPHQRQGIGFLWNCLTGAKALQQQGENHSFTDPPPKGCILADEMGLGKTLMTISTIFALHRRRKDHRFIVVCPSSLVANWGKEFDKWLGRASQPKRVVIRKGGDEGLAALRAFVPIKPHKSEVLVVSYDLFRMNSTLLTQAKQIGLLVVDEGHRLKNTSGSLTLSALEALACEARLLITGTPIQNNLAEFYNVANFVCPGLLGDLPSFRRVYERPIAASNNKNATSEQRIQGRMQSQELERITKTFMLRRLQKDILKSLLPPRNEFLLFCRPSQVQCSLYKSMTSKAATNVTGASAEALTVLCSLRKLCSHPSLVMEMTPRRDGSHTSLSGKLVVLESLLNRIRTCSPSDKVVVVSNFTSVLSVIEESIISKNQWTFKRLDGSTDQCNRQSLVDSFNRSTPQQSFLFLLSSKAGGCGLNLIGANRLIMVDADFNPATDMQAMARIYRQGQTKPCFVYRLFLSGTVEEVIYQRQCQKGNLASLTVDGGNTKASASGKGFTKEELRDCFTLKEGCDCDTKRKLGSQWPDYNGPHGLETQQNCNDEALLAVADKEADTLSFVHVVTDAHEESTMEEDNHDLKRHYNDYESVLSGSSDEEYEFDE